MLGIGTLAKKVFGTPNDRKIKATRPVIEQINALEDQFKALSDAGIIEKTAEFKGRVAEGEDLDALLPEAFANCREAARRALGLRAFDVQLMGGIFLHQGNIAEMKTGEGKTLVATFPAYLNALTGKGVHIVTVNDYLAKRDSDWMGKVYAALGMTTGVVYPQQPDAEKQAAYAADITYATNNELGFDYLRDNMKAELSQMYQRDHYYAIVDEVDSILIDEARTPLIISGPSQDRSELYVTIDKIIPELLEEHYTLDEKSRNVTYTEDGNDFLEQRLHAAGLLPEDQTLYDPESTTLVHHVNQGLRAHKLFTRDKDYIVRNDEVVLIDEFTGRMMSGRRLSDGLHQAIEAKEGCPIRPENVTLASVTFQNYFRLYDKLAGMTGTASTEASEFMDIYGLEVIEIPTNRPISRVDDDDEVYRTQKEKLDAIVMSIAECQRLGQPLLVGTVSIEKSEQLSELLSDKKYIAELAKRVQAQADDLKGDRDRELREYLVDIGGHLAEIARTAKSGKPPIAHQVLNARYHEQEANIIAQAGVPGAVTIATNMAGRGTDIQLGGNAEYRMRDWLAEERAQGREPTESAIDAKKAEIAADIDVKKQAALAAGGLYVLATERHESRRIDNQLRGRSGRQGDPGRSKFFLSLQDDLMRIFGSERMDTMLVKLGLKEGEAIVHPWINKALERAQKKVEARNFDVRKNLLKFDDVLNDQRKVIYEQRLELMDAESIADTVEDMREEVIQSITPRFMPERAYAEQWDVKGLSEEVLKTLNLDLPIEEWAAEEGIAEDDITNRIRDAVDAEMKAKRARFGDELMNYVERSVLMQTLDHLWRDHIVNLDHLRSVVGFRGYGQRDPLQEYKQEAFELFQALLANLRNTVVSQLTRVELVQNAPAMEELPEMEGHHIDASTGEDDFLEGTPIGGSIFAATGADRDPDDPSSWGEVGRNEPCPCGSGKKYKHCHGAYQTA